MITEDDEVVVAHSTDWNSALAYFSARRMLMIPDSQMFYHSEKVRKNIELLEDESVPLMLMIGEARGQTGWIAERIEQLGLWPQPVFEWGNHITAYARSDRFAAMRKILEDESSLGISMDQSAGLLPIESRVQIAGTDLGVQISALGFEPELGVLPFGVSINSTQYGKGLLLHATSELHFEIPPEVVGVEIAYFVSSASFSQRDFDGMSFHVEVLFSTGELLPLALDWVSPQSDPGERTRTVSLGVIPPNSKLLIRALPGPYQNNAFDQGWLHRVTFIAGD
ncbi:hypothetical protein N9023_04165 [Opitutaceae bacterium]|nr:hypothetical protein [Opitutaceae bacterium]